MLLKSEFRWANSTTTTLSFIYDNTPTGYVGMNQFKIRVTSALLSVLLFLCTKANAVSLIFIVL